VVELGNLVKQTATVSLNHELMLSGLCVTDRGCQWFVSDSSVAARYMGCAGLDVSEAKRKVVMALGLAIL
jgi:hypothetical protein